MRKAVSILLHDANIQLDTKGSASSGVFIEFHSRKYQLRYEMAQWLARFLGNEFSALQRLEFDDIGIDEDYEVVYDYILEMYAKPGPHGTLEIELHCTNGGDDPKVDWKEYITHYGPYSVRWETELTA